MSYNTGQQRPETMNQGPRKHMWSVTQYTGRLDQQEDSGAEIYLFMDMEENFRSPSSSPLKPALISSKARPSLAPSSPLKPALISSKAALSSEAHPHLL
ncbi:hypothetical protein NHX12_027523 [Muraenolepis orangiensis]|uniref:Uncharacterized protein n=1 Tax=Muraenolepis orangiensis TaxID=630683 RepID=A0A9Q0EJ51_9TELE|nr:hypothetical protein NHX12_027523 [Muraenolepis orangiensis]